MRKEVKNALIIFVGGFITLIGVYSSYLYAWAGLILIMGIIIFIYGLYKDLKQK